MTIYHYKPEAYKIIAYDDQGKHYKSFSRLRQQLTITDIRVNIIPAPHKATENL